MSSKRRRRARKRARQTGDQSGPVQIPYNTNARPEPPQAASEPAKVGPGQEFVQELIDVQSGPAKRYRNVATTPLALAFYRGQLHGTYDSANGITAEDRHSAGQRFEKLWEARHRSGVDLLDRAGGSGDLHWWTDHIADASEAIRRLRARMYVRNYLIVQRFCGEGYSMAESLRGVVEVHPSSVVPRVREALDDLVTAMTGRVSTAPSTPGTARQHSSNAG